MIDFNVIGRIAKALETNLQIISEKKKNLDIIMQERPDIKLNDLYLILKMSYTLENHTDFKKFILDYKLDEEWFAPPLADQIPFSAEAHSLIIETQSQLNVLCAELHLPTVYLSTKTLPKESSAPTSAQLLTEYPEMTLSKAQSIFLAAQKLVEYTSPQQECLE